MIEAVEPLAIGLERARETADIGVCLENCHLVARLRQFEARRKPRKTGTDDRNVSCRHIGVFSPVAGLAPERIQSSQ